MTSAGILTTDRDFVIRSWDAWIAEATGIASGEAVGRPLFALYPDIAERGLAPRLTHVVENEAVEVLAPAFHHYFLPCAPRAATPNFVRMQQHVTLSPLREAGAVTGVVITIEDVTQRLDREREVAQELRSGDEAVRLQAAQTLAREKAGADNLVRAFGDQSWKVRNAAVKGFAERAGEEVIAALTKALRDQHRDLSVVNAALSALAISGKDVLPELVGYLRGDDPDLRIYVALALGNMNDSRAVPALVEALGDANMNVRFHALEALGRLRAREAVGPVAAVAAAGDFFLAFPALDALALIGDPTIAGALMPLLDNPALRDAVIDTLGRIGGAEVVNTIGRGLSERDASVTSVAHALLAVHERASQFYGNGRIIEQLAVSAIDEIGAARIIDAVAGSTDTDRPALACVIGWLAQPAADATLIALLSRADVRRIAMDALVARGASAIPAIVQAVDTDDRDAAKAAVAVLGRIGSPHAVPRLIAALSGDADIAVVAAHGLGSLGDERAFEPLIELLDHEQTTVRLAAVAALNSIGSPQLHERARDLLDHDSIRVRESAARIVGYFGYADCTEKMVAFCHDADHTIRRAAIEHISFFDDARVPDILRGALKDEAADVRAAAARAIGRLDRDNASSLLIEALGDSNPWVRYHAACSTDALAGVQVLVPLCNQATTDPHPPARIAAIDALGRIADPSTTRLLATQAEDSEDDAFVIAALDALGRTGDTGARGAMVAALRAGSADRTIAALRALENAGLAHMVANDIAYVATRSTTDVANAAIALLGKCGAPIDTIADIACNPKYRTVCTVAITHRFNERPADAADAIRHEDAFVRAFAVEALGWCMQPKASHDAGIALNDDDATVRAQAELALERLDLFAAADIHD